MFRWFARTNLGKENEGFGKNGEVWKRIEKSEKK
jgi:hypothetical protein